MLPLIRWLDDRIGPQDPEKRETYNRVWGLIGILAAIGYGVRWVIVHLR